MVMSTMVAQIIVTKAHPAEARIESCHGQHGIVLDQYKIRRASTQCDNGSYVVG